MNGGIETNPGTDEAQQFMIGLPVEGVNISAIGTLSIGVEHNIEARGEVIK